MTADVPREFVDANVLVYANDASAGQKKAAAERLLARLWDSSTLATRSATPYSSRSAMARGQMRRQPSGHVCAVQPRHELQVDVERAGIGSTEAYAGTRQFAGGSAKCGAVSSTAGGPPR